MKRFLSVLALAMLAAGALSAADTDPALSRNVIRNVIKGNASEIPVDQPGQTVRPPMLTASEREIGTEPDWGSDRLVAAEQYWISGRLSLDHAEDGALFAASCNPFGSPTDTIHIYKSTDQGMTWSQFNFANNSSGSDTIVDGAIMVGRGTNPWVYLFVHYSTSGGRLYMRRYRADGSQTSSWVQLFRGDSLRGFSVARNAGDTLFMAVNKLNSNGFQDLRVYASYDSGDTWVQGYNGYVTSTNWEPVPQITTGGSGNVFIAYKNGTLTAIRARRYTDNLLSTSVTVATNLDTGTDTLGMAAIAAQRNAPQNAQTVWVLNVHKHAGGNFDIHQTSSTDGGQTYSSTTEWPFNVAGGMNKVTARYAFDYPSPLVVAGARSTDGYQFVTGWSAPTSPTVWSDNDTINNHRLTGEVNPDIDLVYESGGTQVVYRQYGSGNIWNDWWFNFGPYILSTWPADGDTGVHVGKPIEVHFNEPMDTTTLNFSVTPTIAGTLSWNTTHDVLTFDPDGQLSYSTTYSVEVHCNNLNGDSLTGDGEPNPFTFTTWDAPQVIYSQMDAPGGSYVSQIFYDYPTYSSYLGDDVHLSGYDSVVVKAVELVGGYWAGHTNHPIDSLYLGFTTDSTNLPAWSQAVWQGNLPTASFDDVIDGANNTYIMYLNTPVTLHNGKSWMVAAPYMGYAAKNGEWGWAQNNPPVIYGSAPAWRNPGGGFGYGTNWQRASVLGMAGDGVFRLLGHTYAPSPYWVSHTAMAVGGYGHAVAGWKGRVYAFGGTGGGSNSVNTIRYYDTLTGTWTTTATTLPQALYFASAATVGDKIYIIGGSNSWPTPVSTVYCYSPDGDSISARADLPANVMEHACGVWRGTHIYVMGGGNWTLTPVNYVQVYDIAANTWSPATAMPAARGVLGGAVCGDYVVAVGGNSSGFTYEDDCYVGAINPSDPTSIAWTTATSYPAGNVIRPSTMAYDGKLFISAGYSGSAMMDATYNYDPATDTWTPMPDKTTATVSAGQAALVGRWAYVVGGEGGNQNESLFLGGGTGIVGGPNAPASPAVLSLEPNFPNPVRGRTNISFNLPKAGAYELRVFNITGQMVDRISGTGQAGPNRLTWNAGRLAAGVYLYSVSSNGQSATRKLVVVK